MYSSKYVDYNIHVLLDSKCLVLFIKRSISCRPTYDTSYNYHVVSHVTHESTSIGLLASVFGGGATGDYAWIDLLSLSVDRDIM